MNNSTIIVGIAMISFLLVSPSFLQIQKAYAKDAYWTGYDDGREDRLDGKRFNDYCSPNLNDDAGCAMYKLGYRSGWTVAGFMYGGQEDYSRHYEAPEKHYNDDDDDDN